MPSVKMIPLGKQDFMLLREMDCYYVDKSLLIHRIMTSDNMGGVFLFTRPRRFGKSLSLSMIDAFFDIRFKGNNCFDGLKISEHHEYDEHRNRYPVLYLDLKNIYYSDYEGFLRSFSMFVLDVFRQFDYLLNSEKLPEYDKETIRMFRRINNNPQQLIMAFKLLISILRQHHGEKVVVLIDEYDSGINSCTDMELRRKLLDFFKAMLTPILKGNSDIFFSVITGVFQITRESLFSGLNNLLVDNIFDTVMMTCSDSPTRK